ncbi:MAG TPA: hypothetical protein VK424_01545 [Thermoplasmata archaeon]|nr:hypothetical protein [Thermoplasmata archaeon]
MGPRGTTALVLLGGGATLPLLAGTTVHGATILIVPIFLLTLVVAWGMGRVADRVRFALPLLVGIGVAVAVFSIVTGILNGFSDEPYSTPAYAALGWGLYTHPVHFTYLQYGTSYVENSYDVYLPLLTFLQVPGLDYRWVSLAAWGGSLYWLRRDPVAAGGFATPWIPLLAANGQNDFVPLLALTVALAVPLSRGGTWAAEVVALALKQLANVVVVLYHLARREYLRAAAAVAITAALLLPFLWIDAGAVYCHVIVGDPGNTCVGHSWTFFVFKRNYWLYPTWVAVVFHRPLRSAFGRFRGWVAPGSPAPLAPSGRAGERVA